MNNVPVTTPAKRIATLYNRRLTTAWSEREVKQFKTLFKNGCFSDPRDLDLIERYYTAERRKPNGIHRRDLATFLNNFQGELDRAVAYCESHPIRSKVVRFTVLQKIDDSPEAQECRRLQRAQCKEELKRSLGSGMKTVIIICFVFIQITLSSCQHFPHSYKPRQHVNESSDEYFERLEKGFWY